LIRAGRIQAHQALGHGNPERFPRRTAALVSVLRAGFFFDRNGEKYSGGVSFDFHRVSRMGKRRTSRGNAVTRDLDSASRGKPFHCRRDILDTGNDAASTAAGCSTSGSRSICGGGAPADKPSGDAAVHADYVGFHSQRVVVGYGWICRALPEIAYAVAIAWPGLTKQPAED